MKRPICMIYITYSLDRNSMLREERNIGNLGNLVSLVSFQCLSSIKPYELKVR